MKTLNHIRIKANSQQEFNKILSLFQADGYDVDHMRDYGYDENYPYYWGKAEYGNHINSDRQRIKETTYYESFEKYMETQTKKEYLPAKFQVETCCAELSKTIQERFFAAGIYWHGDNKGEICYKHMPWLFFGYWDGQNTITFGEKEAKIPVISLRRFFTQDFAPRAKVVKINDKYSLSVTGENVQVLENGVVDCEFPKSKLAEIKTALEKKSDNSKYRNSIIHTPTPELFNLVVSFLKSNGFDNSSVKFHNYIVTGGSVFIPTDENAGYYSYKKIHIDELFTPEPEVEIRLNEIYTAKIGAETVAIGCQNLERSAVLNIINQIK